MGDVRRDRDGIGEDSFSALIKRLLIVLRIVLLRSGEDGNGRVWLAEDLFSALTKRLLVSLGSGEDRLGGDGRVVAPSGS